MIIIITIVIGNGFVVFTDELPETTRRNWFYPVGQFIEFELRACDNARIRLAQIPKNEGTSGYDIVLGAASSITKLNDDSQKVTVNTPQLLNCQAMRKFWITWSDGVRVGTGKFNTGSFLSLTDAALVSITAVSITTPTPSSGGGEWLIKRENGMNICLILKSFSLWQPSTYLVINRILLLFIFVQTDCLYTVLKIKTIHLLSSNMRGSGFEINEIRAGRDFMKKINLYKMSTYVHFVFFSQKFACFNGSIVSIQVIMVHDC